VNFVLVPKNSDGSLWTLRQVISILLSRAEQEIFANVCAPVRQLCVGYWENAGCPVSEYRLCHIFAVASSIPISLQQDCSSCQLSFGRFRFKSRQTLTILIDVFVSFFILPENGMMGHGHFLTYYDMFRSSVIVARQRGVKHVSMNALYSPKILRTFGYCC
jgi:hypothetical protein